MHVNDTAITASELANLAVTAGVQLGANPTRTILYYKQLGLLKPNNVREGSVRRAYYSVEDLAILQIVQRLKARGLTLQEIRESLQSPLHLSEEGRSFVEQFRSELPETEFVAGDPITGNALAFLVDKALSVFGGDKAVQFLMCAFVGQNGAHLDHDTIAAGQQPEQD